MHDATRKAAQQQRVVEIATAVRSVIEGCEFHEAFIGIVSAFAGAIVEGAPNEREARIAAIQFGEYLQGTVDVILQKKHEQP